MYHKNEAQATETPTNQAPGAGGGTPRGVQLKRDAARAGDFEAQEAALKPKDDGPLPAGKVTEAIGYNARRARRQGAAFVKGLQGFVGAPATGTYDTETVLGVASYQDSGGLLVDGKVGPRTEGDLRPKLDIPAAASAKPAAKPAEAKAQGAPKEAAPVAKDAKPADVVKEVVAEHAKVDPAPKAEGEATHEDAAKEASPAAPATLTDVAAPQIKAAALPVDIVARLKDALLPIANLDKDALSLGTLPSWTSERAAALAAAITAYVALPAGPERTTLEQALGSASGLVAGVLSALGAQVRDHAVKLINDASVLKEPAQQPTLPTRADVGAYQAGLRGLGTAASDALVAASGLKDAVTVAQDGALALFQGLTVLAARATWKQGVVEPGQDGVKAANADKDNALKGIFQDAGWGNITTTKVKDEDGNVKKNADGTDKKKVADWCGMFVGANMYRGGGIDEELRAGFLHTSNVLDYFNYSQKANAGRAPKSIWADGAWHDLQTYHSSRGAARTWTSRATVTAAMEGDGNLNIRPGDVVLIDHDGNKKAPQHITMVESYDPGTKVLTTIEGNTGGIQAPDGKVTDKAGNTDWKKHRGPDGSGVHTRDMTNMSAASRDRNKATGIAGSTVFGFGRPSVVDYEEHSYAKTAVPENMKSISPDEMRALAQKRGAEGARAKKIDVKKSE